MAHWAGAHALNVGDLGLVHGSSWFLEHCWEQQLSPTMGLTLNVKSTYVLLLKEFEKVLQHANVTHPPE